MRLTRRPKPSLPQPPPASVTVYVLKDGRKIVAYKVLDAGDELSVKDENGKFVLIKKAEIQQTIQE